MAKKDKTKKLPKTIAGVKVPKELRDAGAKLIEHPVITDLVAAALIAAAAAIRESGKVQAAASAAADEAGEAAGEARRAAGTARRAAKAAAAAIGKGILDELQGAFDDGKKRGGGGKGSGDAT